MNINIVASKKFHNAPTQYRADVEEFTLLRLTCGSIGGQSGGAFKTATVGDDRGAPVYPDQEALMSAMKSALVKVIGSDVDVKIRRDRNARLFGEIKGGGSEVDCIKYLEILAEDIGQTLGLNKNNTESKISHSLRSEKSNGLCDLYDAICHTEGEEVYLSDGFYLQPDGELIER